VLSFQQYIRQAGDERLLEQIARNMVVSGHTIEDTFQFLPQTLNEGFFRRLGAAWRAFWNPDQETYTRQQVEEYVAKQTQAIQAQLQTMLNELGKAGTDKAAIQRMLEKMNAHFSGVAATLDHAAEVDRAMATRSGGGESADVTLPPDPGGAWDALQKIPAIQRSEALNTWWNGLPAPDKEKILKLLGLEGVAVEGRHLRKPLEAARAAGKI